VTAAAWDDDSARWTVTTESGEEWSARFLILATGCLSARQIPAFRGLESFEGERHHTADWPGEGVEVAGERVGVIGTGSTGIQIVPELAPSAAHLYVFQRTANFSVPNRNKPLEPEALAELEARYPAYRQAAREAFLGVPVVGTGKPALETLAEERTQVYEERWQAGGGMPFLSSYTDLLFVKEANDTIADFVRAKIREAVDDPATAELLTPRGFPLGAKRLAQDEGYFETFNRENVTLVDVRSAPIEEVTPTGLRLAGGREYELDTIVFATGSTPSQAQPSDRPSRSGWDTPPGDVGRGAAYVPPSDRLGLPEHVRRCQPGQPGGARQRGRLDRAARRLAC
jgi:cyclohexanone monooxygenase